MTADELEALAAKATQGPWFVSGVRFRTNGRDWPSINRYDESKKQDENIACVGFDPRNGKGLTDAKLIVALVNNAPRLIEALHASETMDEDWLEETISDSLEMDWHPRDAARLIIQRLAPPATEAGG